MKRKTGPLEGILANTATVSPRGLAGPLWSWPEPCRKEDDPMHSQEGPVSATESKAPVPAVNAFDPTFLDLMGERDQPPSSEADTAGPWRVEEVAGGWGCFAEGEVQPEAVFREREVALLAAAALPPSAAAGRFRLENRPQRPYPILHRGEVVGHLAWWREDLVTTMGHLAALTELPSSLAHLLEAAGVVALERMGKILAHRVGREG
jgi:hypothetical protein